MAAASEPSFSLKGADSRPRHAVCRNLGSMRPQSVKVQSRAPSESCVRGLEFGPAGDHG